MYEMNLSQINSTNSSSAKEPSAVNHIDVLAILSAAIASVGIIANMTVAVAFLNHRKLRKKIPNIFIVNQVRQAGIYLTNYIITRQFIPDIGNLDATHKLIFTIPSAIQISSISLINSIQFRFNLGKAQI